MNNFNVNNSIAFPVKFTTDVDKENNEVKTIDKMNIIVTKQRKTSQGFTLRIPQKLRIVDS